VPGNIVTHAIATHVKYALKPGRRIPRQIESTTHNINAASGNAQLW
jgi:hypothetical protein